MITQIRYRQNKLLKTAASAEEMLQFLRDRELWNPLSFAIPCRGEEEVEIYAGWQPVQTLFVGLDDSWAVWTPQGYYDASAIGDEFFGWVHNRGRDQTPGFYRAEHLRSKLEKTDVIRELLVAGQLSKAFERAGMDLPINYHNPVPNLLRNAPLVRILEPIDGADLKDQQSISVVAEVLYAAPQDFQNFQLKAYVNQSAGSLLKTRRMTDSNVFQYSFKIKPTDPTAVVQVKLFDANMPPGKNVSHDDRLVVDASSRIGELEVHFVGIGGSDYPGPHFDLSGCEDVEAFRRQLNILRPKSNYQLGEQLKFFEDRVTQQNIKDSRKQLANKIQPDQLLIVFLAGHGDLDSYGFYFIPAVHAR